MNKLVLLVMVLVYGQSIEFQEIDSSLKTLEDRLEDSK